MNDSGDTVRHPVIWIGQLLDENGASLVVYDSRNNGPHDTVSLYVAEENAILFFKKSDVASKLRNLPDAAEDQRVLARTAYGRFLGAQSQQEKSVRDSQKHAEKKEMAVDDYLSNACERAFSRAMKDVFQDEGDRYTDS